MMKALLRVRFRALFHTLSQRNQGKKGRGTGMKILMIVLFAYLGVVFVGMFAYLFHSLAEPYHQAGLDWLYFAMAGLMALGLNVIGSVFITQNQLYDVKDNDLLLSMPIPPSRILASRMIPLLALSLLFSGLVLGPAGVVYGIVVGFTPMGLPAFLLSILMVTLMAQAITCLLGWLLHQLLQRMNRSVASAVYMVVFLGLYFYLYSQAGNILTAMAAGGGQLAGALKVWAWPLYAMGLGCTGEGLYLAAFLACGGVIFALVCWFLSATFLRSTLLAARSRKRRKVDYGSIQSASVSGALQRKELRRFLRSPVYLTNMGLGLVLVVVLAVLGVVFRGKVLEFLDLIPELRTELPLAASAMLVFLSTTICISTPSISLEGKSLWILQSMPLTARQILLSKLRFHCVMTVPVLSLSGLVLALTYGFSPADILLTTLFPGLSGLLCGLLGLVCGLRWARFDWTNEAYPCKQSMALLITMLGLMALVMVLSVLYVAGLYGLISATLFLGICTLAMALACLGLYRLLLTWGCKAWNAL